MPQVGVPTTTIPGAISQQISVDTAGHSGRSGGHVQIPFSQVLPPVQSAWEQHWSVVHPPSQQRGVTGRGRSWAACWALWALAFLRHFFFCVPDFFLHAVSALWAAASSRASSGARAPLRARARERRRERAVVRV